MKIIPYYRLRLKKRNPNAVVPQSQRDVVQEYADQNDGKVGKEFIELEVGKMADRPELRKAIEKAQAVGGKVVIADAHKLTRDLVFLQIVADTKADFVCPTDYRMQPDFVPVFMSTAVIERVNIRKKTKDSLAKLKAEGVPLGSARPGHWEGREHLRGWKKGAENSAKVRADRAKDYYALTILPKIMAMRAEGKSDEAICDALNAEGYKTTAGKPFNHVAVYRIRKRYVEEAAA